MSPTAPPAHQIQRRKAGPAVFALALAIATGAGLEAQSPKSCSSESDGSNFDEGAWCVEHRSWENAIPWWLAAVAEDPEEDADAYVVLGGRMNTYYYLPFFYLGASYFESREYRAALACHRESLAQGAVTEVRYAIKQLRRQLQLSLDALSAGEANPPLAVCLAPRPGSAE